MRVSHGVWGLALAGCIGACSSSDAPRPLAEGGPLDSGGAAASSGSSGGKSGAGGSSGGSAAGGGSASGGKASGGSSNSGGANTSSGGGSSTGGQPSSGGDGWLYTKGNKIYVTGDDAAPWVGRGVNIDDLVEVTHSETNLVPNDWGRIVQAYLAAHAN